MPELVPITVPELPDFGAAANDDLVAVWRGDRLGKADRSALRGTKTFSGPTDPPNQPSEIVALSPILDDRWRNTETGAEWRVSSFDPFTWTPDGNVKGADGTSDVPGPPGPSGANGLDGESGPPGASGREVQKAAGTAIANWRAVLTETDDTFRLADNQTPEHRQRVTGIVAVGGGFGDALTAQTAGDLFAVIGHGLTVGATFFAGPNGTLVTDPPTSGWRQILGTVVGPNHIVVALGEASLIEEGDAMIEEGGFAVPATGAEVKAGSGKGYVRPDVLRPELDRIIARVPRPEDYEIVADAVIASDGTLAFDVPDQTAKINAYLADCRDVSARPSLPRGPDGRRYHVLGTLNVYDEGDYLGEIAAPQYATVDPVIAILPDPDDLLFGSVDDVLRWDGLYEGSSRIDGMGFHRATFPAAISPFAPAVVTRAAHGLAAGVAVQLATTGTLPAPLVVGQTYYVVAPTANGFSLASTVGGVAIATTSDGSGTHTVTASGASFPAAISRSPTAVITAVAHGLRLGDLVRFPSTTGTLPAPFMLAGYYYVVAPTADTFGLAAAPYGVPLTLTGAGSGTPTIRGSRSLKGYYLTVSTTDEVLIGRQPVARTGAQQLMRQGQGFYVNSDDGRLGHALRSSWAPAGAPDLRTINVTISQGAPAVFTRAAHGLVELDIVRLSTTSALPAPLIAGRTYYAINVTADTFNLSENPRGPNSSAPTPIATTAAGSGTQRAIIANGRWPWTDANTEIKAQRVRHPIGFSGFRIAFYAPSPSSGLPPGERNKEISIQRCNVTLDRPHARNPSATPVQQGVHVDDCAFVTLNDITVTDLLTTSTNYGISLGMTCDVEINSSNVGNCRRAIDQHYAINTTINGGCYPNGIGAHMQWGTKVIGATIGPGFHISGGDLSVLGCRMGPGAGDDEGTQRARIFNLREDIHTFSGLFHIGGGTTIDVDTRYLTDDPALVYMRAPSDYRTYREVRMPDAIVIDESVVIRVVGGDPTRKFQLLNYLRGYGPGWRQRIRASKTIRIVPTVTFDSLAEGPRCTMLVTNPDQLDGGDMMITVANVPSLDAILVAPTETKTTALARLRVHNVPGPVAIDARPGAYRYVEVEGPGGHFEIVNAASRVPPWASTAVMRQITANRTVILPPARRYPPNRPLYVGDADGQCGTSRRIVLTADAGDTIQGAATADLASPYAGRTLRSDGVSTWF